MRQNKTSIKNRTTYTYYHSDGTTATLRPGENGITEADIALFMEWTTTNSTPCAARTITLPPAIIEAKIKELEREVELVEGLAKQAIQNNAREVVDQSEWTERNGVYLNRHVEVTKMLEELDKQKADRLGRSQTISVFVRNLERNEQVLIEFDESFGAAVIDCVVVGVDDRLTFKFKNGAEIEV